MQVTCPECLGTGKWSNFIVCGTCRGTGWVDSKKLYGGEEHAEQST